MAGKPSSLKFKDLAHCENSSNSDDHDDTGSGNDNLLVFPLEKRNLIGSRKKLLVLDLNGVLVRLVYRPKIDGQNYPLPDAIAGNYLVFHRPFCVEFLEFCFERFEVGIWSFAKERNLNLFVSTIKEGLKDKLRFVWGQDKCTDSGFKSLEKKDKPIFFKELRKLWEDPTLPWGPGQYSSSNTLLIDDGPHKALLNPPNTAIFPQSYKVEPRDVNGSDLAPIDKGNDNILGSNGELRLFLDGLVVADDVPSYIKEHPFGQPAITESHPDWDYYLKIIDRFR